MSTTKGAHRDFIAEFTCRVILQINSLRFRPTPWTLPEKRAQDRCDLRDSARAGGDMTVNFFSPRVWRPKVPEVLALAVVVMLYAAGIYVLVHVR